MQVHIWCPRVSDSAISIRNQLLDSGVSAFKTIANITENRYSLRRFLQRVNTEDLWINWGAPFHNSPACNADMVLNNTPFLNKRSQLLKLQETNIPTLEVSDKPKNGYLGRSINHQGGRDLINNNGRDYYTKKVDFSKEIRIHIYRNKSIRSGLKVPAREQNVHPWIRSYDTGWRINYSHAKSILQKYRDLAKGAIQALDLDFGAVDIGISKDSTALVLEVNTAPGIEGGTLEAYVAQFLKESK